MLSWMAECSGYNDNDDYQNWNYCNYNGDDYDEYNGYNEYIGHNDYSGH